jgi:hypothetical protein
MAVENVGGGCSTRSASHVAWPTGHPLAPNRLLQVGGGPPRPYKYPPTVDMRTHTFGDSTCKAPILSVVARYSVVGGEALRVRGSPGLLRAHLVERAHKLYQNPLESDRVSRL